MRPTVAQVRLDAIIDNYRLACDKAPGSRTMAVIKANAYGHGMLAVARSLESRVHAFAVATIDEAVELRDGGIQAPVLIMQGVNDAADFAEAAASDFWVMLHQQEQLQTLLTTKTAKPLKTWVKLDTGMHRLGFSPEALDDVCTSLASSDKVQQGAVLCTHLACADDLTNPMTQEQLALIKRHASRYELSMSIANSAGILFWPETHANWNRPGIMLSGSCPANSIDSAAIGLRAAMSMHSEIIAVRNLSPGEGVGYGGDWVATRHSKIGTIAIGYGDGYPRHAPSGTPVLVNGQRVPLTGRVSMDAVSVDLTDLDEAEVGDPVELWGENLSLNEVASSAGTIGYELIAGLTGRVPLQYQSCSMASGEVGLE